MYNVQLMDEHSLINILVENFSPGIYTSVLHQYMWRDDGFRYVTFSYDSSSVFSPV